LVLSSRAINEQGLHAEEPFSFSSLQFSPNAIFRDETATSRSALQSSVYRFRMSPAPAAMITAKTVLNDPNEAALFHIMQNSKGVERR
jgi:hypothetical protein